MSDKTPARPNSQWATGKRRAGKSKSEPRGFFRGAKVGPHAAPAPRRARRK